MKKQYKVLNPISFGGRIERGTIISMSDYDAKRFDKNDIEIYSPEEDTVIPTTEETPNVDEIKAPEDGDVKEETPEITPEPESEIKTETTEETPEVTA